MTFVHILAPTLGMDCRTMDGRAWWGARDSDSLSPSKWRHLLPSSHTSTIGPSQDMMLVEWLYCYYPGRVVATVARA